MEWSSRRNDLKGEPEKWPPRGNERITEQAKGFQAKTSGSSIDAVGSEALKRRDQSQSPRVPAPGPCSILRSGILHERTMFFIPDRAGLEAHTQSLPSVLRMTHPQVTVITEIPPTTQPSRPIPFWE